MIRGASPLGLPNTLSRAPLRRRAPFAWLASPRSFAPIRHATGLDWVLMPVPDHRVDELRQQLRSLGYLDAGVDRFLLVPASGTRGPIALAARAAVRVGLLGGILLGPAAAIGMGARAPGLVNGVRDAIVVALYLALLFFVAVGVISFGVSTLATLFVSGRPARGAVFERLSRGAGLLLTLGSIAYLTLWWRNANAGFGWSAPVWTSFALVVAVAISLLLGHAQRITTLAVLAAAAGPSAQLPAVTSRSWRVVLAGGAIAFAGGAVLLLATAAADAGSETDHPPLPIVNSRAPLRLIALDGFDLATYERLRDSLPNLKAALGGRQVRLQPQDTSDPARAWTTIATGMLPDVHGVRAIETRRVAGLRGALAGQGSLRAIAAATDLLRLTRPSVASSIDRRVKTIWEVAEDAGLRTAVVNWWATWPASQSSGIVITDRAVLRLEHGGPLDGEIAPAAVYGSLQDAWPSIRQQAHDTASASFSSVQDPAVAAVLRRSAELDAIVVGILRALPPPARDLDVVYLPGLDIAQNALLGTATPVAASSMASRVEALRQYYGYLDGVIGPLLDGSQKTTVVIVTQPGRVQSSAGGLLAVSSGGDVGARARPEGVAHAKPATPADVAPTIWLALGLPLSRELAGAPIPELFGASLAEVDRFVPSYGRPFVAPTAREGRPLDQEMIDRLRSLGYVK